MSHSGHQDGSLKVILTALLANLGIAASKFLGAFFTHSASMMAEAIHSTVDSTNQILLLIGQKAEKKSPDETFPMGYGRETFFWSFIVALLLFSLGGVFAIYEGFHKLHQTELISNPWVALSILIVSLLLEGFSFYSCLKEIRLNNPFGSLRNWMKHSTDAGLLVIFLEDLGALLGLLIAFCCLLLSVLLENSIYDAIGSIVVGGLLVVVAIVLGIKMKSLLIGVTPHRDYKKTLQPLLESFVPTASILKLIAIQTGGNEVMIAMKITHGCETDVVTFIEKINLFEKKIKNHHAEIRWLFVEPDFSA